MGTITNFAGKYTDPNLLNLPSGAARDAVNVVSDRPGVAECRVGMDVDADPFLDDAERLSSGVVYGAGTVESTGGHLYRRNLSEGLMDIGALTPAGSRLRFAVGGDDLYMTGSEGVMVMDGPNSTPSLAGVAAMPDLYPQPLSVGPDTTNWLAVGATVGYRSVLGRNDAEGRVMLGAPSSRVVFINDVSGVPSAVYLRIPLPTAAQAGDFVQLYRTTQAADGVNPGDVMFQTSEVIITSAHVTAGYIDLWDNTPDVLLGAPLYTNSTSVLGGITMANNRPPLAQDVALFRQSLFLADVTSPHRIVFRLIGVPQSTDTITISGKTVTIGPLLAGLTAAQQIEFKAREIIAAVNADPTTGVRGYYVSGENDPPGMMAFERTTPTASAFTVQSTSMDDISEPPLGGGVSSTQDVQPNGISVSKSGLFYAFPSDSAYHLRLGRADKRILRLIVNRDSLFAFKEDGVWVIYPAGAGWGYRQISTDIILQYPDSLAVLDNQVYAFTNRGIVAVDESGIEEVDAPIKNYVAAIRDTTLNAAPQSVFAVADPVRLRYTLFFWDGGSEDTTAATHALVYNGKTDTWTERDDHATGGFIGADGLLWLGNDTNPNVRRERNTGTASDYKDPANTPIHVTIEWASIISENPSGASRFTEMHLLTEEPTEGPYTFTFTSHYDESETCQPEGENLPEVRMWVPDGVQRTTRLKVRMERDVLEEYFAVLGITNSAKYYRGPATRG